MARKPYDKEKGRLWSRWYQARARATLLQARRRADLDLQTGMTADECIGLAEMTARLRHIEFQAYTHPETLNVSDCYQDIIALAAKSGGDSGATGVFIESVGGLLNEARASLAAWQEAQAGAKEA